MEQRPVLDVPVAPDRGRPGFLRLLLDHLARLVIIGASVCAAFGLAYLSAHLAGTLTVKLAHCQSPMIRHWAGGWDYAGALGYYFVLGWCLVFDSILATTLIVRAIKGEVLALW